MSGFGQTVYFDARLTPNRSLSGRGFAIAMAAFAVISLLAGLAFLSLGAAPVIGFFGLDALILWVAFKAHFNRAAEETRVTVTAESVRLVHTGGRAGDKQAEVPTAFARIELDDADDYRSQLRVEHGRTGYIIGRFLTHDERASLAQALRAAIGQARRETLSA